MPHLLTSADRYRRRLRTVLLCGVGVILLALIAVGGYGLVTGGERSRPSGVTATTQPRPPTKAGGHRPLPARPGIVPSTSESEMFARGVAEALFTWDTTSGIGVDAYEQPLLAVADPSGTDTPGMLQDLSNYFPSPDSWAQLRNYRTRQSLAIHRIFIPQQWEQAITAAAGRQIQDGVLGYTVTGLRHRSGVWLGQPVATVHAVSFTLFVACPPATQRCALLRLSTLNNPLR